LEASEGLLSDLHVQGQRLNSRRTAMRWINLSVIVIFAVALLVFAA
jgi:hypothetical protein